MVWYYHSTPTEEVNLPNTIMFLYTKRSKKVIKWIWGFFALMVSLSMVFAFSGFTNISAVPQAEPMEVPPEVMEKLQAQSQMQNASSSGAEMSPELQMLMNQINNTTIDASGSIQMTPEIQALLDQINASATPESKQQTDVQASLPNNPEVSATSSVPELRFGL